MHKPKLQLLVLPPDGAQAAGQDRALKTAGYSSIRHHLPHMEQRPLDDIVRQVHTEGYYATYVSVFAVEGMSTDETVEAICRWARQTGLKVGFSLAGNVCVFELE